MDVKCGIMDQYIIATAKKGTAELLDCAKIEHEYVPLEMGDSCFVVMNTKKKRLGKEIYELAEKYLADSDEKFHITNKYELDRKSVV